MSVFLLCMGIDAAQAQTDNIRVLLTAQQCGSRAGASLIQSAGEWQQQLPHIVLPAIDWTRGQVLLVRMGSQNSSGYRLSYPGGAHIKDKILVLPIEWHSPDPGKMYAQVIVEPCIALVVPRSGYQSLQVRDQSGTLRFSLNRRE